MPKKKLTINKETIKNLKTNVKAGGSTACVADTGVIGTDTCITVYPCNPKPTLYCVPVGR